ncbi:hypothetical protein K7459_12845 [Pseudomonas fluorescens]|uniref:Uncharacterized protein n=1 Tax=Pseudomonas fluorescens (strain Pf0-1) TaxID=205922 RepID=Q3KAH9_PSEPF|nr:hypothetical protein [Pseudomonas fluorescens]ABA75225.1 hypothetical protein Pfl01_3487 [Pseudomonas fluorescens Pf0-1]MBY9024554.1 hypothetical protein [Pseudomonas fluorescens]MBY9030931.1 hypothetical protein [Pseudomonas fluorescens]MBY9036934.1 hypothetical protein [Pseudomonas fluorescens]MBY9043040.1 hypothetical protein [Pseudomonas fluorescens]
MTDTKIKPVLTVADAQKVIALRKTGMSRAKIIAATGFPERFVREHMAGVEVDQATKAPSSDFEKAVARVFPLSVRPQGIKDYELRQALYEVYGTKWSEEKGTFEAAYDKSTMSRIKARCRELARGTDQTALFVMDWICDEAPTASRVALEQLALELEEVIQDKVNSFMEMYATGYDADQLESTEAQRKQQYAARRHLLKLAIKEYSQESTVTLLARTLSVTDAMEATSDVSTPVITQKTPQRSVEAPVAIQEDSLDAFFEEAVMLAEAAVVTRAEVPVTNTTSVQEATNVIDYIFPPAVDYAPIVVKPTTTQNEEEDLFGELLEYTPQITARGGYNATDLFTQSQTTE